MGRFHFVRQIRTTFFWELTSQPSIQSFTNLSSHATSRWSYHCSLCCDYYNCCFYWSLSSYCLQDPKSCPIFWPNRALYFDSLQRFCYLLPPFSLQVKALVVDSSEDFWSTTDLTSDGTKFLVEKNLVFTEKGWTDLVQIRPSLVSEWGGTLFVHGYGLPTLNILEPWDDYPNSQYVPRFTETCTAVLCPHATKILKFGNVCVWSTTENANSKNFSMDPTRASTKVEHDSTSHLRKRSAHKSHNPTQFWRFWVIVLFCRFCWQIRTFVLARLVKKIHRVQHSRIADSPRLSLHLKINRYCGSLLAFSVYHKEH